MSRANHFRPAGNHTKQSRCTSDLCLVSQVLKNCHPEIDSASPHPHAHRPGSCSKTMRKRLQTLSQTKHPNSQLPTFSVIYCAPKVGLGTVGGTALLHTQPSVQLEALRKNACYEVKYCMFVWTVKKPHLPDSEQPRKRSTRFFSSWEGGVREGGVREVYILYSRFGLHGQKSLPLEVWCVYMSKRIQ